MSATIRITLRTLRQAPGFTLTVMAILALGIGANVAVFTLVNAVLFRPLPFGHPAELVTISESHLETGQHRVGVLPGSVLDWRERTRSLEAVSMLWSAPVLVTNREEPARIGAASVSPNFFALLSVSPLIGRTFPASESEAVDHQREIVISYGLWQRWFGRDSGVLGQTLEVQGRVPLTIVGVMPASFQYPRDADFWRVEIWDVSFGRGETDRWRKAIGRLAAGASIETADRELRQIATQLAHEFPSTNAGWTASVTPLAEEVVGRARAPLVALLAAVSLVFLLACVNVAALVLQRRLGRQRELATRLALGASSQRLLRESLTEHVLLASGGVIGGGLLAFLILKQLAGIAPPEILPREGMSLDLHAIAYLTAIALVTVVATGALPVVRSSRIEVSTVLRSNRASRATTAGWRALVVFEIMLAVMLLASAGLMIRTMLNLQRVDVGFDVSGVSTADLMLPVSRITSGGSLRPEWPRLISFYEGVVESVEAVPGVRRAAVVAAPALAGQEATWLARLGIVEPTPDGSPEWRPIQHRAVTPGYFEVLRLPLQAGRPFSASDRAVAAHRPGMPRRRGVAIVNRAAARQFWPGDDPLGKLLTIGGDGRVDGRIVIGVSSDARDIASDTEAQPTVYVPFAEGPDLSATLLARHESGPPPSTAIRSRLRAADALLMVGQIRPLSDRFAGTLAPRRFITVVLVVFASFGLLLGAVGLYGLIGASVAHRFREFAVRLALGATPRQVRAMILGEAGVIVALGLTVGVAGAFAVGRLLQTQLFQVRVLDPANWIGTVLILGAAGVAAAWFPADQASRSDPASMLRAE